MKKLVIKPGEDRVKSINRTIRFKTEYFDRIIEISEKTGVSFNKIVNQCMEYALENLEDQNS
jgi:predicted DNA-binding protein